MPFWYVFSQRMFTKSIIMPGRYMKFEKFEYPHIWRQETTILTPALGSMFARFQIPPVNSILHVVAKWGKFFKLFWSEYLLSPWIHNWKAHDPKHFTSAYLSCVPQVPFSGYKLSSSVKILVFKFWPHHYVALANCLALLFSHLLFYKIGIIAISISLN